jgi:WD40 repeat protein
MYNNAIAPYSSASSTELTLTAEKQRKSSLMAPEVSLNGHGGAIYSIDFDPTGKFLLSASMDKQICECFS